MSAYSLHTDKITRQQFRDLEVQAQDYAASLPPDDLLAHLVIELPARVTELKQADSAIIGLASMPMLAETPAPVEVSLTTVFMILAGNRLRGESYAQMKRTLAALTRSGLVGPIEPSYQQALLEMALGFEPGLYRFTPVGFSDFFAHLHGHRIRYCRDNRKTYVYSDGAWVENRGDLIEAMVNGTVRSLRGVEQLLGYDEAKPFENFQRRLEGRGVPSSTARDMQSRKALWIAKSGLDAKPFLLNLQNGTYDLEADAFQDHAPSDHLTRMSPVVYDQSARCPNFEQMVSDLFGGDRDTMSYVQSVLGYCLSGDASAKRFWVFYGPTADNGKSTLLRVMRAVLGDESSGYYGSMFCDTLMAKRADTKNLGIASLDYKPRVAVVDELPNGCCLNAGVVKAITGDTTGLSARRNFQDPSTHEITYKLVIATNHLPTFDGFDEGVKNRIAVIPFGQKFTRIKDFDQRWEGELPGILNWLIEGYRAYKKSGLDTLPPAVRKATDEAVGCSDPLGLFLSAHTEPAAGALTRISDLREAYKAWLKATGRPASVGPKDMSKLLARRGYESVKSNADGLGGVMAVRGLHLRKLDN